MQELDSLWESVSALLAAKHSSSAIRLWFEESCILSLDDDTAVIQVFNEFKKNIIEKRFMGSLADSFQSVIGYPIEIKLQLKQQPQKPSGKIPVSYMSDNYRLDESIDSMKFHPGNEYTFDNFIVGSSNKFVYAACTAVAASPATDYNPLFIYSKPGLGKTHLLNAIMNEIYRNNPNSNILYVKGDEFTNQMIESISHGSQEAFRRKYRKADVLLIDDIQFIAGKEGTQEEFFHTFNALYEDSKQIIMTSDRPPRDIKLLEDRLRTRFEWGLIADIQPPDYELRIAIMQNKARMLGITLPTEVLTYMAENIKSDIRQIEGAVKKISARCFLSKEPITLELAKECTAPFIRAEASPSVTADSIVSHVAKKYGIAVDDLLGRQRTKPIARARNISIYVIRRVTGLSQPLIGRKFDRDHTTILSSINSVEDEMKQNPLFELEINDLIKEITE